jgi:non-specific protein-tyrosine kinase
VQILEYLEVLNRRKWIIALVLVVTVAIVDVGSYMMTPVYAASATVRIAQVQDGSTSYFALDYAERVMNTYVHLLKSRPFLEEAIRRHDLAMQPSELAGMVSVEVLANTELLKISVENRNPLLAANIANTLGTLLVEEGQKMYSGRGKSTREILQEQLKTVEATLEDLRTRLQALQADKSSLPEAVQDLNTKIRLQEQVYAMLLDEFDKAGVREAMLANSINIVEPATAPRAPSKPRIILNLVLGGLVGLMGGVGLAFVFENLDRRVYSASSLEATAGAPVLGEIPSFSVPRKYHGEPFLLGMEQQRLAMEAFRGLRSVILSAASGSRAKTLLVTSAEPGAGKSTVLANLAAAMAQAGRRVIVIDSDLRQPCLHRVFGLPNSVGLSNAILAPSSANATAQETRVRGVRVLTSGPSPRHPAELLSSSNMKEVLSDLASRADLLLLDSPPVLAMADALGLASIVDGVLLVAARAGATDRDIKTALRQLDKVGAKILGVIFNRASPHGGSYYYFSDYDVISHARSERHGQAEEAAAVRAQRSLTKDQPTARQAGADAAGGKQQG